MLSYPGVKSKVQNDDNPRFSKVKNVIVRNCNAEMKKKYQP